MGKISSPCFVLDCTESLKFHSIDNYPPHWRRKLVDFSSAIISEKGRFLRVISKDSHAINQAAISRAALTVVHRLREAGFDAYLVGGAVRDLLINGRPKDFDIATNATPEQTKALFRSARIIGRRFQIVHVRQGREIIEVTTYRGHHTSDDAKPSTSKQSDKGLLLRDNVYGSLEDDAKRRDLTVNAMYYDPDNETILDQQSGLEDIEARLIRIIGNPVTRYQEDPVRMLRVVRFSARLQFDIESNTADAIATCAPLLNEIPSARLFDEFLKLFMSGHAHSTFLLLCDYHLLAYLISGAAECVAEDAPSKTLVKAAMGNTDARVRQNRPVTPAFLLAAMLWPAVRHRSDALQQAGEAPNQAINSAGQQVSAETCLRLAIPKRFSIPMREIWEMQPKLEARKSKQILNIMSQRRFRAAYDLLLLREQAGATLDHCGDFWTEQQRLHPDVVGSAPDKEQFKSRRKPRQRNRQ